MLASDLELLTKRMKLPKKGRQITISHPTLVPGEYGDRVHQTSSSDTNFYNAYLLFLSDYLEPIHCLNELHMLLLCKTI